MKSNMGLSVKDYGIATGLNHSKLLVVPANQRSYAWEESHVKTLFEDISSAIAGRQDNYFLGTIVLTSGGGNALEVADGQQRLATITILIAAIRDFLLNGGVIEKKAAEKYRSAYLLDYDVSSGESIPRLQLNYEDRDFFRKKILLDPQEQERINVSGSSPLPLSHKRLESAAKIAKEHIQNITAQFSNITDKAKVLHEWVKFLEDSAVIIEIKVSDGVDAFKMFETLNDRGLRASQTDILKNYLFGKSKDQIGEIQTKWTSMNASIEVIGDDELLLTYIRHYWTLYHGYIAERDLATQVQSEIAGRQQAVELVTSLDNYAADYVGLLHPLEYRGWKWKKFDEQIRAYIYVITCILNVEQIRPLLLAIIKKFDADQTYKSVKMLLSLSVRFIIAGAGGGGPLDRTYGLLSKEIMAGAITTKNQLKERMSPSIMRTDEDFKEVFTKCRVSKTDLARYYLRSLELFKQGNSEAALGGTLDGKNEFNIEHIMPNNPSEQWDIPEDDLRLYCKRLGNMALLDPDINMRLGNKSFTEKKDSYSNSRSELTRMIGRYPKWEQAEIEDRQKKLAEIAVQVWNL